MRAGAPWAICLGGSAAVLSIAQHVPGAQWLTWIALVPLFLAIRDLSPGRAALAGAFWGAGVCALAALFSHHGAALTVQNAALLVALPALFSFLGSRQTRRTGFSPLILGLGWVAIELAMRPLAPHGGLVVSGQLYGPALRVVGFLGGWLLVAFCVAYVNASLLEIATLACAMLLVGDRPTFARRIEPRFQIAEVIPVSHACHRPEASRAPPLI